MDARTVGRGRTNSGHHQDETVDAMVVPAGRAVVGPAPRGHGACLLGGGRATAEDAMRILNGVSIPENKGGAS